MARNTRFWLNVGLIAVAHVVLITGLVRWSREPKTPAAQSIVWMGGASGGGPVAVKTPPEPKREKAPEPAAPDVRQQEEEDQPEEDRPILTVAKSEIQLPVPTPKPTPTPTATPRVTPKPTPEVKVTPPKHRPKPKPSPKPTPKPSPKEKVLAKASEKPPKKTTAKKKEREEDVDLEKKKVAQKKPEIKADPSASEKTPKTVATHVARSKGNSTGDGGRSGGASIQSNFGWYGNMLHDRFYSEWVQPTALDSNSKMSALVRIRIEKDGRISGFEIVRPSGNAEVDDSINAVAKRVTKVDPLPAGLGGGDHYDVKINFELHSE